MRDEQGGPPTIKSAVLDYVHRMRGRADYEALTSVVLKHFPNSAWKPTHWAWYRYQICKGRFRDEFSAEERKNLAEGTHAPPPHPEVKGIGDAILNQVRFALSLAAPEDADLRFKINRWIYARLVQDENRGKRAIKQKLWDDTPRPRTCVCGKHFESLKYVELHRIDPERSYSIDNCTLLCRTCHQGHS